MPKIGSTFTVDSGWQTDTGVSLKTSQVTYSAPTINIIEIVAQTQDIADRLQIVSQQIKAIKDYLITTAKMAE